MSPENYKLLCIVAALPGKRYFEDQRPAEISHDRHKYLIELKYLEERAVVTEADRDPLYPAGLSAFYLTPRAEDDMKSYEIEAYRKAEHDAQETEQKKLKQAVRVAEFAVSHLNPFTKE